MKKSKVNKILVNQTKRRSRVFICIVSIIAVFIFSFSFFLIYMEKNKSYYVNYDERSNVDYKVYLKNNEFFEDNYLGVNKQYIANLVDYITANFEYNLLLNEDNVNYKYSYRIEANVDVKSKATKNSLYTKKETLVQKQEKSSDKENVTINQEIKIDYNRYNEYIKKFISVYGLEEVDSTLNVNMYVNVAGSCENLSETKSKESIITMSIPLAVKTMPIDISNNLINSLNNVM